ncbi:mandelate racemase/muconate lactonizing enzyme family protein [Salipiger sp.]|uniref:mandelate racemase/muconate lactonizing enzyme family protein n=1 Tax=Salipiger sp. TaxID=2078585 RepID=UPI003A982208
MIVEQIEIFDIVGRLKTPWRIASGPITELVSVVVRLTGSDGSQGYGECCCRGGARVIAAVIEDLLAPCVIGRSARDIGAIWADMYAILRNRGHTRGFMLEAMSGIDIALWDLASASAGLSLSGMLLGQGRRTVPAYASSILIASPEDMAREAQALSASGYHAIKMKIAGDPAADTARVRAVREAVGPGIRLMLDANSGFDAPGAIAFCEGIRDQDVFWLEEPLPLDDLPGYRRLRQITGQRIALGEGEFTAGGIREFLRDGLVDVVQPNVTRAGGITGTTRIAALAQAFNIPVALHTGASGPICMAATLQLAAALPGILMHEHMYLENPFEGVFEAPLPTPVNGMIAIPDGPGLGLRPDPHAIAAHLARPKAA